MKKPLDPSILFLLLFLPGPNQGEQDNNRSRSSSSSASEVLDLSKEVGSLLPGFSISEKEKFIEYLDVNQNDSSASLAEAEEGRMGGDLEEGEFYNSFGQTEEAPLENDEKATMRMEIVTKLLRTVETQAQLGANCVPGTDLNLGDKVVNHYAQGRFMNAAQVAVNRANWLTRMWKYEPSVIGSSEYLLHTSLYGMMELSDDIFAAGNCYDAGQYKNYFLFCPYGYRLPEGPILVKDLAIEYKYLSNTSEWFYIARKKAEELIKNGEPITIGYHTYTYNESTHGKRESDNILTVAYDDGQWTKPYYDCGGGNIWMMTYTVPFFGFEDGKYFFKGTSGIDIDLRRVDINQCQRPNETGTLNIFGGTDKCKTSTTRCVPLAGLGFRRGSYKCVCKAGYYFIDTLSPQKYFNGSILEEEYAKKLEGKENTYDREDAFQCAPCAPGCDDCVDSSPCIASLNWVLRTILLILQCIIICCLPIVVLFTYKYKNIKVVRAASPVILRIIILGAFFVYSTTIILYPNPNIITCTLRIWLREIGFALSYGALMLKTWRISVIFRVRSAKAIKITDVDLIKRLGVIVGVFVLFLFVRTLVSPPVVIVGRTADNLKAFLCQSDWWDHSFTILEFLFLLWGIRLCIMVRKAPSEFNESKFISMTIYNEFLLSIFLNVSMFFLQHPANPDLLYIIFFCHSQLTITILLCLIFASKFYLVMKGHGKNEEVGWSSKNGPGKFVATKTKAATISMSQHSNNTGGQPLVQPGATSYIRNHSSSIDANKLTENEITHELERIFQLLQVIRDRRGANEGTTHSNTFICSKLERIFEAFKSMESTNNSIINTNSSNTLLALAAPSSTKTHPGLQTVPSDHHKAVPDIEEVEEDEVGVENIRIGGGDKEKEERREITKEEKTKEEVAGELTKAPEESSSSCSGSCKKSDGPPPHEGVDSSSPLEQVGSQASSSRVSVSSNCSFCCSSSACSICSSHHSSCDEEDCELKAEENRVLIPSSEYGKRFEYFNPKLRKRNKNIQTDLGSPPGKSSSPPPPPLPLNNGCPRGSEEKEDDKQGKGSKGSKASPPAAHPIILNLEEKSRFTNEVTV